MEAVNAVRPRLWWGRGRDLLAPVACVDVDGTDFSLTANFDRWSEDADCIFGYYAQPAMKARAEALEKKACKPLERRPRGRRGEGGRT